MKKLLYILVAIVVLIVVIVIIGIPVINNQVSTLLGDMLKEQIALQGLEGNVSYDSITVNSIKGSVTVQGLTVQHFQFAGTINIGEVTATVPVREIVSFARSPEHGVISDVHLAISDVTVAMKVGDIDVSLDLGTSEVQVNGRLDMNFIQNFLAGSVEPGIPQIDMIRLRVDRAELNSSDVMVSMGSLLAEMGTAENADSEPVSDLHISMNNIKMDIDVGGENTTTIMLGRYEIQVQGPVVLEQIVGLLSGNSEIDTSLIDSMSMNLEGGEFHRYDGLSDGESYVNVGTLTTGMKKEKSASNETIGDFYAAMTELQMSFKEDDEKTSLSLGRFDTRVQGQIILDLLEQPLTGNFGVDTVQVDTIRMDIEKATLIVPELSMSVGYCMVNLDGVESVLGLMESNSAIAPEFSGEIRLNEYTLGLNDELLNEFVTDLEMTFGSLPFLRDPESWKIDKYQMKLAIENEKVELSDLALTTGWLDISGSSSMGFSKDLEPLPPFNVDLKVAQYPEALRPFLGIMSAVLFGAELPKSNSFAVQINDGSILWGNI